MSPATLKLQGPAGTSALEPRTMQVLVMLADARGEVVTRERLIERCWGGLVVGDDAINRAVSGVRRALREAGASAAVETVPKIGYRLEAEFPEEEPVGTTRRRAVLAGVGALAVAAAGLGTWRYATRRDPRVAALVERGREALRDQLPDSTQQGIGFFEEALRLAPEDAEAWGNLALARRNVSEFAPPEQISTAVAECQQAARRALRLDPQQADAHAALALLPPVYGDWQGTERRLREVHRRFPDQVDVIGELALVMFSVGRAHEAAEFSRRATEIEPLSPIFQYRRAYHQWTLGQQVAAEQTIDRAMQLWPTHPAVWFARLLIFAGTARYDAALRMLAAPMAEDILGPLREVWRMTCSAAASGSVAGRRDAAAAALAIARQYGQACVSAILALNRINAIDQAFAVADGYLLRRGPLVTDIGAEAKPVNDQRWRKTMMLFVPATAPMRSDPRFERLCADIGLAAYWRATGTVPYFRQST